MKTKGYRNEYIRVMSSIDVDESVKQQIIRKCARYSTVKKIKAGKFKIIAVKKDGIFEEV